MRGATLRHILAVIIVAFAVVGALELSMPCSTWRWPVSGIGFVVPLLVIRAIGTDETRPEISSSARGFIAFICLSWVLSAAGTLTGLLC